MSLRSVLPPVALGAVLAVAFVTAAHAQNCWQCVDVDPRYWCTSAECQDGFVMGVTDCFDNTDDIHCFESCRSHGTFCQLTLAAIQLDGAFLEPLVEGASATDESQVFELAETSRTLGPARRGCRNIIVSRSYGADVAQQIRSMTARVII